MEKTDLINMKESKIAVIMPIHNSETTVAKTLSSLIWQSQPFDELVLVDDACSDKSMILVNEFIRNNENIFQKNNVKIKIIKHSKSKGLAFSYNDGIRNSISNLIVTLHSDVILNRDSLEKLVAPLLEKKSFHIVASYHSVIHPHEVWKKYNFWQKCFFARLVGKKFQGLDGKFDCFKRSAIERIGLFDDKKFRNAGEDGDIIFRLNKIGKIIGTDAEIIHLHSMDPNFSYKDIIVKQKQYSESQGILLRIYGIENIQSLFKIFFREILIVFLFIPYINIISATAITIYSFLYTKPVYFEEYKDLRILALPFLNVYLLFISFFYSLRGIIYGRQKI